jgi:SAM-dependent methyltransferase
MIFPFVDSILDITVQHRILVIGVGRSDIVECLYKKGFRAITAIDVSATVIAKMSQKHSYMHGVDWFCMDARHMTAFADKSFSIVIDKGCTDAIFCSTEFQGNSLKFFQEVFRVMEDDANFLLISHAQPISRVPYLRRVHWAIDTTLLPEGENLTLFTLTRTDDEELIARLIPNSEASVAQFHAKAVSKTDQKMNKNSTTKIAGGGGMVTVTSDVGFLQNLVAESEDLDE